jgi:hypothetical protein
MVLENPVKAYLVSVLTCFARIEQNHQPGTCSEFRLVWNLCAKELAYRETASILPANVASSHPACEQTREYAP